MRFEGGRRQCIRVERDAGVGVSRRCSGAASKSTPYGSRKHGQASRCGMAGGSRARRANQGPHCSLLAICLTWDSLLVHSLFFNVHPTPTSLLSLSCTIRRRGHVRPEAAHRERMAWSSLPPLPAQSIRCYVAQTPPGTATASHVCSSWLFCDWPCCMAPVSFGTTANMEPVFGGNARLSVSTILETGKRKENEAQ